MTMTLVNIVTSLISVVCTSLTLGNGLFLVERQALAVLLDLCFRSVYLFFNPGISSEPLNLSQQKFAR